MASIYRTLLIALCISLSSLQAQAQSNIDSLLLARQTVTHDTLRIRTDMRLGQIFEINNFDSALYYYNRGLELSLSEEMKAYPYFRGLAYENIAFAYIYGKNQTDKGISFLKKALANHNTHELITPANKTEYNIGFFYGAKAWYDSAIFHYNRVIAHQGKTMVRLHESYNNAGLLYFYKGEYALSAQYLTKAMKLKQEQGEITDMHLVLVNLGTSYQSLGEYERAKYYYKQSIPYFKNLGDSQSVAMVYRNIAETLTAQDSLPQATDLFKSAHNISLGLNDQLGRSFYYNGMGGIAETQDDLPKATDYYQKAFDLFTSDVNDRYSSSVLNSLGRVKLARLELASGPLSLPQKRELQQVIDLGLEAWKRAERSNLIQRKLTAATVLQGAYQKLGNYKESLRYSTLANALTNEINDRSKSQALASATMEYETDRIENENTLLLQEKTVQAVQLQQQNLIIAGVVVVSFLLLIIVGIVYKGRLRLQKANTEIEKSLSEKELLLKEIHHRVKNNLQIVSSLLDLQARGMEDEEAISTFLESQNRVKAMALIHQKLYQNEHIGTIDFADYAKQLMSELATLYPAAKTVTSNITTKEASHFDIDTAVPLGLILNELISNAYKYAFQENAIGELNVSVESLGEGKHQLIVSDTGMGLPEGFEFSKAKTLGLRLVRRLAKQLYGSVTYSSESGARFVIVFTDTLQRRSV